MLTEQAPSFPYYYFHNTSTFTELDDFSHLAKVYYSENFAETYDFQLHLHLTYIHSIKSYSKEDPIY